MYQSLLMLGNQLFPKFDEALFEQHCIGIKRNWIVFSDAWGYARAFVLWEWCETATSNQPTVAYIKYIASALPGRGLVSQLLSQVEMDVRFNTLA